jgi:hypothetical protein
VKASSVNGSTELLDLIRLVWEWAGLDQWPWDDIMGVILILGATMFVLAFALKGKKVR